MVNVFPFEYDLQLGAVTNKLHHVFHQDQVTQFFFFSFYEISVRGLLLQS